MLLVSRLVRFRESSPLGGCGSCTRVGSARCALNYSYAWLRENWRKLEAVESHKLPRGSAFARKSRKTYQASKRGARQKLSGPPPPFVPATGFPTGLLCTSNDEPWITSRTHAGFLRCEACCQTCSQDPLRGRTAGGRVGKRAGL